MTQIIKKRFILALVFSLLWPSLIIPQETQIKLKVVADLANIRQQPAIDSPLIHQAKKDSIIEALNKQGEWFRVIILKDSGEATTGYVHESLVTVTEGPPQKIKQATVKPIKEVTPKVEKPKPQQKKPVEPEVEKPAVQKPKPEQIVTSDEVIKRISLKFSVGSNYVAGGQLNEGAKGLADFYRETLGVGGQYKIRPLHLSYLASTEVYIPLDNNFSIGAGLDYYRGELESVVKFDRIAFADYFSSNPRVDATVLNVSIASQPFPFLSLRIGLEYYFAKAFYYYRYQTEGFWQEWSGRAKAQGLGFLAGVSYEYQIAPSIFLFIEAVGHYSKIEGFKGTDNYRESTSYTYSESGPLFFYKSQIGQDKTVSNLFIRERKPTEAWVIDAKEAIIDFSGMSLKAGLKFWF